MQSHIAGEFLHDGDVALRLNTFRRWRRQCHDIKMQSIRQDRYTDDYYNSIVLIQGWRAVLLYKEFKASPWWVTEFEDIFEDDDEHRYRTFTPNWLPQVPAVFEEMDRLTADEFLDTMNTLRSYLDIEIKTICHPRSIEELRAEIVRTRRANRAQQDERIEDEGIECE